MRKLSYFLAIGVLTATVIFIGCKKKTEVTPAADCSTETFPSTNGSATVSILNYTTVSGGFTTVDAKAGDVLSFAVNIIKGTNRPQKLRIYQTDCVNELGTIVSLTGQPGAEDSDTRLDLQNTDSPQIRQFAYTVPTGYSTLYLNIAIDESSNTFTYNRIKLNISNSGIIDTWSNITLGANSNAAASRLSSATGQTYLACDAYANLDYIDITYAVNTTSPYPSYLCSNPARFLAPISLSASTVNCGEDGTSLSTGGGNATYFKAYTGTDFATIDAAGLTALTVSTSDNQYVQVTTVGQVFQFLNSKGKKGLIKYDSGTLNNTTTAIVVDVKVQR